MKIKNFDRVNKLMGDMHKISTAIDILSVWPDYNKLWISASSERGVGEKADLCGCDINKTLLESMIVALIKEYTTLREEVETL